MKMWIGGAWVDSAPGEIIEVMNPATEEVLDTVPSGTPAEVERAVAAAREAFASPWGWPQATVWRCS